jgi:transcriptional antiterminator RfaH
MTSPNWLLLQVKPRQEMRALENLERQQAQCYCPLIQVEKLRRGKRIRVEEALLQATYSLTSSHSKTA